MQSKFDMVIHGEYGGFSLTDEIVEMLRARGCEWVEQCVRAGERWFVSDALERDGEFRRDPVFVKVVRELQERLDRESDVLVSWREREAMAQRLLHGLRVVTVTVKVHIDDHDGKESVRVVGGIW